MWGQPSSAVRRAQLDQRRWIGRIRPEKPISPKSCQ